MDLNRVGSWISSLRQKRDEWFGPPGKPPDLAGLRARDREASVRSLNSAPTESGRFDKVRAPLARERQVGSLTGDAFTMPTQWIDWRQGTTRQ